MVLWFLTAGMLAMAASVKANSITPETVGNLGVEASGAPTELYRDPSKFGFKSILKTHLPFNPREDLKNFPPDYYLLKDPEYTKRYEENVEEKLFEPSYGVGSLMFGSPYLNVGNKFGSDLIKKVPNFNPWEV